MRDVKDESRACSRSRQKSETRGNKCRGRDLMGRKLRGLARRTRDAEVVETGPLVAVVSASGVCLRRIEWSGLARGSARLWCRARLSERWCSKNLWRVDSLK
jgi:hypothetical protein